MTAFKRSLGVFASLLLAASFQTSFAEEPAAKADQGRRLRGFTTQEIDLESLQDMKLRWNANSVRLMMRPNYEARKAKLASFQEAWGRILEALPAYLDKAKELEMAVILDLHEVPNEKAKGYRSGKERLSDFWADDSNLDVAIDCWRKVGALCKGRKQTIWFDILNEPLDWKDFPKVAKKWPDWSQKIIDAVRADGLAFPIVVEVGPGGLCWGFKDFPLLKGSDIVYSTHQYQPHAYTHQGISAISNTDLAKAYLQTNQPWPGSYSDSGGGLWNKERLLKELAPMIEFQKRTGARIYISEFGCVRWAPGCEAYIKDNLEIFESLGWDWSFHALHENPIWSPDYAPSFKETLKAKEPTPLAKLLTESFKANK